MYQNDLNEIIMTVEEFHKLTVTERETVEELIEIYGGETSLATVLTYIKEKEEVM